MDLREEKGLQIAATAKLQRSGERWFVPSQSHAGDFYTVKPDISNPHCTCPDHESLQVRCKHIYAAQFVAQREQGDESQLNAPVAATAGRKTYPQKWPAYNQAQTQEKDQFQTLLHELCRGIGGPSQKMGRPRLSLEDMIFSAAFKVYSTVSGRRFMSDLRDAHGKGFISK